MKISLAFALSLFELVSCSTNTYEVPESFYVLSADASVDTLAGDCKLQYANDNNDSVGVWQIEERMAATLTNSIGSITGCHSLASILADCLLTDIGLEACHIAVIGSDNVDFGTSDIPIEDDSFTIEDSRALYALDNGTLLEEECVSGSQMSAFVHGLYKDVVVVGVHSVDSDMSRVCVQNMVLSVADDSEHSLESYGPSTYQWAHDGNYLVNATEQSQLHSNANDIKWSISLANLYLTGNSTKLHLIGNVASVQNSLDTSKYCTAEILRCQFDAITKYSTETEYMANGVSEAVDGVSDFSWSVISVAFSHLSLSDWSVLGNLLFESDGVSLETDEWMSSFVTVTGMGSLSLTRVWAKDNVFALGSASLLSFSWSATDALLPDSYQGDYQLTDEALIDKCVFEDNLAATYGTVLFAKFSMLSIKVTDSLFVHNFVLDATEGFGAVFANEECEICSHEFVGSTFRENGARLMGGVYYGSVNPTNVTVRDCVFEGNRAEEGGVFYLVGGESLNEMQFEVDDSRFQNNGAKNMSLLFLQLQDIYQASVYFSTTKSSTELTSPNPFTGGVLNCASEFYESTLAFRNVSMDGNLATNGGGVLFLEGIKSSTISLKTCNVSNNFVGPTANRCLDSSSSAQCASYGQLIDDMIVVPSNWGLADGGSDDNQNGGVIWMMEAEASASLWVDDCLLSSNKAYYGKGGVVYTSYIGVSSTVLNCEDSLFWNNEAVRGGVWMVKLLEEAKSSVIRNCEFIGNKAYHASVLELLNPSTIEDSDGGIVFEDLYFRDNVAFTRGGAVVVDYIGTQMTVAFTRCTFEYNTAKYGAAVAILEADEVEEEFGVRFDDCTFLGNSAKSSGALFLDGGGGEISFQVRNCEFFWNTAFDDGGAIGCRNGAVMDVWQSHFEGNTALDGGCIFAAFAERVAVDECSFNESEALNYGGVIAATKTSVVKVSNSSVRNCEAYTGGVVYTDSVTNCSMESTTVDRAVATQRGGVVRATGGGHSGAGYLLMDDCVVSNSYAAVYGGSLYTETMGVLLKECTFTDSASSKSGGLLYASESTVVAKALSVFHAQGSGYQMGAVDGSGGVFALMSHSSLHLSGSFVKDAFAGGSDVDAGGGVVYAEEGSNVYLQGNLFSQCAAIEGYGGFLAATESEVVFLKGNVFHNGSAIVGGALSVKTVGNLTAVSNVFVHNSGNLYGGAMLVDLRSQMWYYDDSAVDAHYFDTELYVVKNQFVNNSLECGSEDAFDCRGFDLTLIHNDEAMRDGNGHFYQKFEKRSVDTMFTEYNAAFVENAAVDFGVDTIDEANDLLRVNYLSMAAAAFPNSCNLSLEVAGNGGSLLTSDDYANGALVDYFPTQTVKLITIASSFFESESEYVPWQYCDLQDDCYSFELSLSGTYYVVDAANQSVVTDSLDLESTSDEPQKVQSFKYTHYSNTDTGSFYRGKGTSQLTFERAFNKDRDYMQFLMKCKGDTSISDADSYVCPLRDFKSTLAQSIGIVKCDSSLDSVNYAAVVDSMNGDGVMFSCEDIGDKRTANFDMTTDMSDVVSYGFWLLCFALLALVFAGHLHENMNCCNCGALGKFRLEGAKPMNVLMFALQVFDFLTDVNLMQCLWNVWAFYESNGGSEAGDWLLLATLATVFTVVPYSLNVAYTLRLQQQIQSKKAAYNSKAKLYLTQFRIPIAICVLLSGGIVPTLNLLNSRVLNNKLFAMGLTRTELNRFSAAKFAMSTLCENVPQLFIQIGILLMESQQSGNSDVSGAVLVSLASSLLSFLATGIALFWQGKEDSSAHYFQLTLTLETLPHKTIHHLLRKEKCFVRGAIVDSFPFPLSANSVEIGYVQWSESTLQVYGCVVLDETDVELAAAAMCSRKEANEVCVPMPAFNSDRDLKTGNDSDKGEGDEVVGGGHGFGGTKYKAPTVPRAHTITATSVPQMDDLLANPLPSIIPAVLKRVLKSSVLKGLMVDSAGVRVRLRAHGEWTMFGEMHNDEETGKLKSKKRTIDLGFFGEDLDKAAAEDHFYVSKTNTGAKDNGQTEMVGMMATAIPLSATGDEVLPAVGSMKSADIADIAAMVSISDNSESEKEKEI